MLHIFKYIWDYTEYMRSNLVLWEGPYSHFVDEEVKAGMS